MDANLFSENVESFTVEFPTSYQKIMERIDMVDPVKYSKTRNFTNGAVTYLSPYISRGVISVKQILDVVLQKGFKPNQIEKFIQELAWREYFQRVWQHTGNAIWNDMKYPQPDVLHRKMIQSVDEATTGIHAIDNGIKYLYSTGYMHNHIRMYVASLICNIGKAHWLQPSKWMYYHLLDGDIASNNCSWQWVSGAFSAKKYYFNQENVNKYTFSNQRNTFIDRSYVELVTMSVPDTLKSIIDLDIKTKLPVTAIPFLDITKSTLIYNSYNLDVKWREGEDVNRVLLLEPTHFEKYPVSEKVLQFIIDLSKNIDGIVIYVGEVSDIVLQYRDSSVFENILIISKEHPAFLHYPGIKDPRDWMFPEVIGYYNSFFSFWKNCEKFLK